MEITFDLNQIQKVAKELIEKAEFKTWLFEGNMGVGKTTLIKELAKQLGVKETINSPTFSLVNEYLSTTGKLYHFDFYRIDNESEAMDIGIEEYFYSDAISFIEWPKKIATLLPNEYNRIIINKNPNGSRTLHLMLVN